LAADKLYVGTGDGVFVREDEMFVAIIEDETIEEDGGLLEPVGLIDGALVARTWRDYYRRVEDGWEPVLDTTGFISSLVDDAGQLWVLGKRGYRWNGNGFEIPFDGGLSDYSAWAKADDGRIVAVGVSGRVARFHPQQTPLTLETFDSQSLPIDAHAVAFMPGVGLIVGGAPTSAELGGVGLLRRSCEGWGAMESSSPVVVHGLDVFVDDTTAAAFAVGERISSSDPDATEGVILRLPSSAGSEVAAWTAIALPPGTPKLTHVAAVGIDTAWVGGLNGTLFEVSGDSITRVEIDADGPVGGLAAAGDTVIVRFNTAPKTLMIKTGETFEPAPGPSTAIFGLAVTSTQEVFASFGGDLHQRVGDRWVAIDAESSTQPLRVDSGDTIWGSSGCIGSSTAKTSFRLYSALAGPNKGQEMKVPFCALDALVGPDGTAIAVGGHGIAVRIPME
jgi:hypothetical protein